MAPQAGYQQNPPMGHIAALVHESARFNGSMIQAVGGDLENLPPDQNETGRTTEMAERTDQVKYMPTWPCFPALRLTYAVSGPKHLMVIRSAVAKAIPLIA